MSTGPRRGIPPKTLAVLALVVIGTLGGIVGFAVDRTVLSPCYDGKSEARGRSTGSEGEKRDRHRRRWDEITQSLNLTPDQTVKINLILDEQSRQLEIARKEIEPQMKAIMNTTRTRIDSLLNEEQKAKLDQIQKEREARKRRQ